MAEARFTADELAAEVQDFAVKNTPARARWEYCLSRVTHSAIKRSGEPYVAFHAEAVPPCARFLGLSVSSARYRLQSIHLNGYDDAEQRFSRTPILKGMSVGLIQPWQIGHVYFARVKSHPHVLKIGFSRRVRSRLEDIERAASVVLTVRRPNLRVGTLADEKWWHDSLKAFRISGEWFFDPKSTERSLPPFLVNAEGVLA